MKVCSLRPAVHRGAVCVLTRKALCQNSSMLEVRVPKTQSISQRLSEIESRLDDKAEQREVLVEVNRRIAATTETVPTNTYAPDGHDYAWPSFACNGTVAAAAIKRTHEVLTQAVSVGTYNADGRLEVFASKDLLVQDLKRRRNVVAVGVNQCTVTQWCLTELHQAMVDASQGITVTADLAALEAVRVRGTSAGWLLADTRWFMCGVAAGPRIYCLQAKVVDGGARAATFLPGGGG